MRHVLTDPERFRELPREVCRRLLSLGQRDGAAHRGQQLGPRRQLRAESELRHVSELREQSAANRRCLRPSAHQLDRCSVSRLLIASTNLGCARRERAGYVAGGERCRDPLPAAAELPCRDRAAAHARHERLGEKPSKVGLERADLRIRDAAIARQAPRQVVLAGPTLQPLEYRRAAGEELLYLLLQQPDICARRRSRCLPIDAREQVTRKNVLCASPEARPARDSGCARAGQAVAVVGRLRALIGRRAAFLLAESEYGHVTPLELDPCALLASVESLARQVLRRPWCYSI